MKYELPLWFFSPPLLLPSHIIFVFPILLPELHVFLDIMVCLLAQFSVIFMSYESARSHMLFAMELKVFLEPNMEQSPKWLFFLPW